MRVLFQPGLAGNAWPGVLVGRTAAFGETWVGEGGLLGLLETQLGLGGPVMSDLLRAAALLPVLRERQGFWSRSLEVDPLGVGLTLVRRWDSLRLHGWAGQPASSRLVALNEVCEALPAGVPDRLRAVIGALEEQPPGVVRVVLPEPVSGLPALWRELLEALGRAGTVVAVQELEECPTSGDLQTARRSGFYPTGDGSLQLVRAAGPLQAAEDLAAWLAAQPDLSDTVIIAPDDVLDSALCRHGLPTSGSASPNQNLLAGVLPLVLEAGWSPPDPERMLELLNLPVGPVPRRVARELAGALQEWPAVGSQTWNEAWSKGLAREEDGRREKIEQRMDVLLRPAVEGGCYPAAEVQRRVRVVLSWLRGRRAFEKNDWTPWNQAVEQCEALLQILDLSGLDDLSGPVLQRLVSDASQSADVSVNHAAQAGISFISSPSALLGPVVTLVWWNFTRDSADAPESLPLWPEEAEALTGAGVSLPDPGAQASLIAERWRRPLLQTRGRLLLLCPEHDEQDQEQFPHPLWDELVGALRTDASPKPLLVRAPQSGNHVSLVTRKKIALPSPRRNWPIAPESLPQRDTESPSSLGSLLGCSFKYCLTYGSRIRPGASASLPAGNMLWGSLVHHVLELVFDAGLPGTPERAAELAAEIFDRDAPQLASSLLQPGEDASCARVREAAVVSARELTRQLQAAGVKVTRMEQALEGVTREGKITGYADMVTGPTSAVIDLKWGGTRYRRTSLADGTAYQLAAYSHMSKGKKRTAYPPVAYFILAEQRLLSTDTMMFKEAELVDGPDPKETWKALCLGWKEARESLGEGYLVAAGIPDEDEEPAINKDVIEEGVLRVSPVCGFCDFGFLCGRCLEGQP